MNPTITVQGLDKALKRYDSYNKKKLKGRSKAGFKKAGPILRNAVKAAAPVGPTGTLKRATRYKTLRGDPPAIVVGPRHSIRRQSGNERKRRSSAPHAHLVIGGTKDRRTVAVNGRGLRLGPDFVRRSAANSRMTPNPYVQKAVEDSLDKALDEFKEAFQP